ncbi:MAG TPA: FAD-dependent oxidoreductase [Actinomycetota bacterium]|jgi:NADH dehydrogenase
MHVVIVGGGAAGLNAARHLEKRLLKAGHRLTLVTSENFFLYQSLLPEAAGGTLEPRHVVVPLRSALRRARVVVGSVERVDAQRRMLHLRGVDGDRFEMPFDQLVLTPGSRSRTLPVPGLAEHGIGFKTLGEAILLRNHVLSRLEAASQRPPRDPRRRAALTFVFVGAGYAGVESLAELEDLSRWAMKHIPELGADEPRWMLIEARDEILPEIDVALGRYAARELARRGIEIKTGTRLDSIEGGVVRLSDGESFPAETLVWTTGVKPEPLAATSSLPVDDQGRLQVDAAMRVVGYEGLIWAAGDSAAVPDLVGGGFCPPSAQYATRQGKRLAANVRATLEGGKVEPFRFKALGVLCSLGRYKGVAIVLGVRLRGLPAWFVARTYHLLQLPTLNRKVRVVLDWTLSLFFPRDVAALGSLHDPTDAFERASDE